MAFVPVPATVKVAWFWDINGQPAMNRLHVRGSTSLPTEAGCALIASTAANWWIGNVKSLVPSTIALREVLAISIAEENGPQATFSSGLPSAGTNGSPSLPGNNAFCVSLRSGLTGRSARGRWYWGGLTEADVTGNEVAAGSVTGIVGAIDNLLSAMNGIGAVPVIVSYFSGGVPRPGGPVTFVITDALAVDNIVDSQRGRLH